MDKNLLIDGMMDSGLGRTLSSYGRPKMRSRSEERMITTPIMPMNSVRSEALSEPIAKMHSNHKAKYMNHCVKEDSVLNIPISHSRMSQNEQYGNCNGHDYFERQIVERHKPRKDKTMENHNITK